MIEALAADRTDDALDVQVLPRRARRRTNDFRGHSRDGARNRCKDGIVGRHKLRNSSQTPRILTAFGLRFDGLVRPPRDSLTLIAMAKEPLARRTIGAYNPA